MAALTLVPSARGEDTTTTSTAPTTTTIPVAAPPDICSDPTRPDTCRTWAFRDPWTGRPPLVMTTTYPLGGGLAGQFAYVSWIRTEGTIIGLYPGYKGPGPTSLSRGPMMVPTSNRGRLLATFNSGFYFEDCPAGFYAAGRLYHPMVNGLATLVRYTDGHVDIITWHGPARPTADIQMARQNLGMLVNNGTPTAASAINSRWGVTLGGVPAVWRTALGIDENGNLMYLAAPAQTSASLAALMAKIHAVRAMQLDINPEWPIFNVYNGPGARGATLTVPNPNQIPGRFLYSSTKDFFAVFVAHRPGEPNTAKKSLEIGRAHV